MRIARCVGRCLPVVCLLPLLEASALSRYSLLSAQVESLTFGTPLQFIITANLIDPKVLSDAHLSAVFLTLRSA